MSTGLKETLVDHSAGNLRILNNMAAELLASGARNEVNQLDEKLFLELFSRQPSARKQKKHSLQPA